MIDKVDCSFTYGQFEDCISNLIHWTKRDSYLEMALDFNYENRPMDDYVSLISNLFPENIEKYDGEFYDYWGSPAELIEDAIYSFIYGVVDYETGAIVAPCAHELLAFDSRKDINPNSEIHTVPISSIKDLWQICTGEIPVRRRFS